MYFGGDHIVWRGFTRSRAARHRNSRRFRRTGTLMVMQEDIEKVLISAEQVHTRIKAMALEITRDFSDIESGITIVPIMTGAMIFTADLIREMPIRMKINLMTVSSYPGASLRTQGVTVLAKQLGDVHGRHVLLIDDILDSGGTLRAVIPLLKELGADSVRSCVLLRKDRQTVKGVQADYVGFDIPDEFVVGYGLDYDSVYRNLRDICTLKPSVYSTNTPNTP
ncbi:MAG: hypoxanthine phosphoribosyltransferase [Burkholderiales bacterium]|nr:hypoxanthine phosphoribosyltransferase [Phycisphaerae bacterium]